MSRSFGTIGQSGLGSGLAVAMLLAAVASGKPRRPRILVQAEQAEADKRTERQKWNDEVDERRRAKQIAKKGYAK